MKRHNEESVEAAQRRAVRELFKDFVRQARYRPPADDSARVADATPATPRKTRTRAPRKGRRPRP